MKNGWGPFGIIASYLEFIYAFLCLCENFLIFVAVASLLRWSRGEENALLSCIFGRVAELNWMWKEAMDEFNNQVNKEYHL